jgi:thiol-disulfide isomerase/thioredoxin
LILGFLISCEKRDSKDIKIHIETVSQHYYNYQYEDLRVIYQIYNFNQTEFELKCLLLDNNDFAVFKAADIKNSSSNGDTLSLWSIDWYNSVDFDSIDFYKIESKSYKLQISLLDKITKEEYHSNKLLIEINRPNPDKSLIDNFTLFDINGDEYELVKLLEDRDFVMIYGFATWCGWSRVSIPQVNQIDSLFDNNLIVLGVEGSNPAPKIEGLKQFVIDKSIEYPIFIRMDNLALNGILYPDYTLFFPSFVLINSKRREIYRQDGYLENMIDSIAYYMNKN